jgi:hypothetical protein
VLNPQSSLNKEKYGVSMDAEIAAHLETLESHVATLEGIIHVMLQEIEAGTIQESAAGTPPTPWSAVRVNQLSR